TFAFSTLPIKLDCMTCYPSKNMNSGKHKRRRLEASPSRLWDANWNTHLRKATPSAGEVSTRN
ncbi:MAG: hypothetical protein ABIP13_03695, partial [Tepidiformaceae bacterium]